VRGGAVGRWRIRRGKVGAELGPKVSARRICLERLKNVFLGAGGAGGSISAPQEPT
jgi:hypothetical protein